MNEEMEGRCSSLLHSPSLPPSFLFTLSLFSLLFFFLFVTDWLAFSCVCLCVLVYYIIVFSPSLSHYASQLKLKPSYRACLQKISFQTSRPQTQPP